MNNTNLISDVEPCKVNARQKPFTDQEDYFIAAFSSFPGIDHLARYDLTDRTPAALKRRAWWLRTHRRAWWNKVQAELDSDLP